MVAMDGIQTTFDSSLVICLKSTQRQIGDLSETKLNILVYVDKKYTFKMA